jgi:Amt family ammonium transporter
VLAAHGIAGLTGILFIGFFAQLSWNGVANGLVYGDAGQLVSQVLAAIATPAYAFVATWVILRVIGLFTPLRGTEHQEALGMDVVHHGEEAYATGEGAILVTPEGGVEDEVPVAPI